MEEEEEEDHRHSCTCYAIIIISKLVLYLYRFLHRFLCKLGNYRSLRRLRNSNKRREESREEEKLTNEKIPKLETRRNRAKRKGGRGKRKKIIKVSILVGEADIRYSLLEGKH